MRWLIFGCVLAIPVLVAAQPSPAQCESELLWVRSYLSALQRQREDLEQALIRTRLDLRDVTQKLEEVKANHRPETESQKPNSSAPTRAQPEPMKSSPPKAP